MTPVPGRSRKSLYMGEKIKEKRVAANNPLSSLRNLLEFALEMRAFVV